MFKTILRRDYYLVIFTILIIALLYLRDLAGFGIGSISLTLFVIGSAVLLNKVNLIYFIYFLLPLACGLPSTYIYPLLIVLLFVKQRTIYFSGLPFFLLFVVLELLHYPFYDFPTDPFVFLNYIAALFLFVYSITFNVQNVQSVKCAKYFCLGVTVLTIGIISNTIVRGVDFFSEMFRIGNMTEVDEGLEGIITLSINANSLAYYSIASLSISLLLVLYKKISYVEFGLYSFVSFIGGLFTMSRTWFVTLFVMMILFVLFNKKNRLMFFTISILAVLVVVLLINANPIILEGFTSRFVDDMTDLRTAGDRTVIFSEYQHFLNTHSLYYLFGTGASYYREVTLLPNAIHNSLQQILLSYGFIGLIIMLLSLFVIIKKSGVSRNWISIVPMIVVLIFLQTLQFLNPAYLMCPVAAAVMVIKAINI